MSDGRPAGGLPGHHPLPAGSRRAGAEPAACRAAGTGLTHRPPQVTVRPAAPQWRAGDVKLLGLPGHSVSDFIIDLAILSPAIRELRSRIYVICSF